MTIAAFLRQQRKCCNFGLIFLLLGFSFAQFEAEVAYWQLYDTTTFVWFPRITSFLILFCNGCVFTSVALFHKIDLEISAIELGIHDWRAAVTSRKLRQVLVELTITLLGPIPGIGHVLWLFVQPWGFSIASERVVAERVILAHLMLLKGYLLARCLVLNSAYVQDGSIRKLARRTQVSLDCAFVIRSQMWEKPLQCLLLIAVPYWLTVAWIFSQCERYGGGRPPAEGYLPNALWFIMNTLMTIGYGGAPKTTCGRILSISTGIVGILLLAAIVTVVRRIMYIQDNERRIQLFVKEVKLRMKRTRWAAILVQYAWIIKKNRRKADADENQNSLIADKRRFLQTAISFRRIKQQQRLLTENQNNSKPTVTLMRVTSDKIQAYHKRQQVLMEKLRMLQEEIDKLYQMLSRNKTAKLTNFNRNLLNVPNQTANEASDRGQPPGLKSILIRSRTIRARSRAKELQEKIEYV